MTKQTQAQTSVTKQIPVTGSRDVAKALKDFRVRKGWTQRGLASTIGVSPGAVGQWESERPVAMSPMALLAIANLDDERRTWWLEQAGPMYAQAEKLGNQYKKEESERTSFIGSHRFVAVPLISATAGAGPGRLEEREDVEGEMAVPRDLCRAPKETACIRVHGSSMETTIMDGSIVAVDQSQTMADLLLRQIVAACHPHEGLVVKRLANVKGDLVLLSDQPGHPPLPIEEGGWVLCGKVIWWVQRAEGR